MYSGKIAVPPGGGFTINGTLDTSFIGHERSECLINECLEKFIKELHTILFELTNFTMTFRKRNS
jgi:hypothetical protein